MTADVAMTSADDSAGLTSYYEKKIEHLELTVRDETQNLRRLQAQRNELNSKELQLLQEPGSYVGEVVKQMGKSKVLVKVNPEGKYVVDVDKTIDIAKCTPNTRVALRNDSYVDPLVSLMKVEKVPDSTYDMIGGLDKQIREIKEVIELPIKHPELFDALGVAQPKGVLLYGPPGTGKTLLARAVAHHTDCTFIRVSGAELVQKYIGEGSRMNIKVIMATNRIDILDAALLRPGRIDRKIEFPNPTEGSRIDIMRIHSRKMNLLRGINLKVIAEKMPTASGAECKAVCTEAGMFALRERRIHVTQEDFEMAVSKVMKKDSEQNMSINKLWK
ncbi:Lysosomal beta glucosidase [Phytophthora nicotianae]|uniref:Lysosomal beta glucosidase n=1 Tax=Phytophthora nicotianae TaxID=4792 RepID=A0A0W8D9I3_PHYNI|nr:Lysosomal beta glucosidase [Phytophthora nicotianae]